MNNTILVSMLFSATAIMMASCDQDGHHDKVSGTAKNTPEKVSAPTEARSAKTEPLNPASSENTGSDSVLVLEIENAKKISKAFGRALKKELKKAMKEGGAVNALDVCHTEAMPITKKVASEQGVKLSRVSLKNRNPDNAPNDWQKKVLVNFDRMAASGEKIKTMAYAKIVDNVDNTGKKQFRYMKALPTLGMCLECHGTELDADVSQKIMELYPEDKATGYDKGQVRGAIVLTKDM